MISDSGTEKFISGRSSGKNIGTLGKDILRYIPGIFGPAIGLLAFTAIFTRAFETFEYGHYSLVFSIVSLLAALFGQWLVQSINRFVGASGDLVKYTELIGIALSAIILAVTVGALAIGMSLWIIVDHIWRPFILTGTLMTLFWSLFQPLLATYQATFQAKSNSIIRVAQILLRLGLAIMIVFLLWQHPAGLILASAIGSGILVTFMWKRLKAPFAFFPKSKELRFELKRWALYGFPMVLWFACTIFLSVGDRYIIHWLRNSSELGIYAANYGIVAGGAGLIAAPIRLAAHPFLMRAWGNGNHRETAAWLSRIITVLIFAMLVVIGPMILFAEDIAKIVLAPEYVEGYKIMPIVFGGISLWHLSIYLHKPFEFYERTRSMMRLAVLAVVANIVLNIIFVPRFGYIAAAWNTVAAYSVYAILTGVVGRSWVRWQIEWKQIVGPAIVFIASILSLAWFRGLIHSVLDYSIELVLSLLLFLLFIFSPAVWTMIKMLKGLKTA